MRKSQFKLQAEKGTENRAYNEINVLYFYKASQYRWEDSETADPQYDDITYHLNEEAAIKAADAIHLDLGFEAIVERIYIEYSDFNGRIDFGEEFELVDLDDYRRFNSIERDQIYTGTFNNGGDLPENGFIVYYRHHQYMNYAYSIESIEPVMYSRHKTYSDLRNDSDSTMTSYAYVASNLDELAEDFEKGRVTPFDKINSGGRIVREFLAEQYHPNYISEEDESI